MASTDNVHILGQLGLILVSHQDRIDQQSIGKIICTLREDSSFREDYFLLIDIRKATIDLNRQEIGDLSLFVFDHLGHTGLKKFAVLASDSQVNKTVQFIRDYRHSSKYQIFSSLEAALNWLKIPLQHKDQVQLKLDYLKQLSSNQSPKT